MVRLKALQIKLWECYHLLIGGMGGGQLYFFYCCFFFCFVFSLSLSFSLLPCFFFILVKGRGSEVKMPVLFSFVSHPTFFSLHP